MGTFLILRKQITIRSRVMIQDSYDLHSMTGIVILLRYVIRGTFFVEGCGAVLLGCALYPAVWSAARSLVCGISWPPPLLQCRNRHSRRDEPAQYVADPDINVVTILIIVVSGLGFLVWKDLMLAASRLYHREYPLCRVIQKLKLAHEAGACDDGLAGCDRYGRNFLHGIFESEDLRRDAGRRKMAGGNVPVGDDADRGIFYNPTGSLPATVTAALVYSDVYRR